MYLLILQAFPRKRGTAQQRKAPLRLQICVCLVCVINSPGSDPVRAAAHKLCVTERPGSDPGDVVRAGGDHLVVACGEGTALRILEIQPEGRRTMTAREFLAGRHLATNDRFGT